MCPCDMVSTESVQVRWKCSGIVNGKTGDYVLLLDVLVPRTSGKHGDHPWVARTLEQVVVWIQEVACTQDAEPQKHDAEST